MDLEHYVPALVPEDAHHPSLAVNLEFLASSATHKFAAANNVRYNFRKANFPKLYEDLLKADWTFLDNFDHVNIALDNFYEYIYTSRPKCSKSSGCSSSKFPYWVTNEIKNNIKTKENFRRKWLRTKNNVFYNEYKRLRSLVKNQLNSAYHDYINQVEINLQSNPSGLWSFINVKKGTSRIPSYMIDEENNEYTNPQDIVDAFAKTFANAQTNDSTSFLPTYENSSICSVFPVSQNELISIMKNFPNKLTAGDNSIPSFVLRDCSSAFVLPLSIIINLALKTNTYPERWKIARVIPIFKKGSSQLLNNYRPISILSNFSKVMEQVLYKQIYYNVRPYISPYQHGFVKGRSTITNLSVLSQTLAQEIDNHGQIDVIYTDFSKAFDCIPHRILLRKLNNFGFSASLLQLICSYIDNRVNYISYNGFRSYLFTSNSGVPQGSNLGPLLFNIFVNDLLLSLSCPVLAYADDLKIYSKISCIDDTLHLQANLDKIVQWCNNNIFKINKTKCFFISFSRKNTLTEFSYSIDGFFITKKESIKDLGVIFDERLTFNSHIEHIANSANKSLGFIMRVSKYFRNVNLIKILFYAFVLSKLEYASLIWYPIYITQHMVLDRILKKFLKFLSFKCDGTYPERGTDMSLLLQRHQMSSLSSRRDFYCARFLAKLVSNEIDCIDLLSNISVTRSSQTGVGPNNISVRINKMIALTFLMAASTPGHIFHY
ncbi:hypothetical protein Zmor_021710 [Zophobas morio]|uniref:Reverse transcriptase domain-containing protein n=1 Tax=Zophobas morio TaxID=2755281 RepID=A0AA38I6A3_9CUCU|nr:hypothetical protein Zmor_021710 [Zophobas morio]